jgi:hypothetical protein
MPPDLVRRASQSPTSSPSTLSSSLLYVVLERWQLAGQGEGPSVNRG